MVYLPDYYNIVNLVTAAGQSERHHNCPSSAAMAGIHSSLDTAAASGGYFTNHCVVRGSPTGGERFQSGVPRLSTGMRRIRSAALAYDAAKLLFQAMGEAGTTRYSRGQDQAGGHFLPRRHRIVVL